MFWRAGSKSRLLDSGSGEVDYSLGSVSTCLGKGSVLARTLKALRTWSLLNWGLPLRSEATRILSGGHRWEVQVGVSVLGAEPRGDSPWAPHPIRPPLPGGESGWGLAGVSTRGRSHLHRRDGWTQCRCVAHNLPSGLGLSQPLCTAWLQGHGLSPSGPPHPFQGIRSPAPTLVPTPRHEGIRHTICHTL